MKYLDRKLKNRERVLILSRIKEMLQILIEDTYVNLALDEDLNFHIIPDKYKYEVNILKAYLFKKGFNASISYTIDEEGYQVNTLRVTKNIIKG